MKHEKTTEMVELCESDLATVSGGGDVDVAGGAVSATAALGTGLLVMSGGAAAIGLVCLVGFGAAALYAWATD